MQVQEEEDVDPATGQPMGSSNVVRFLSALQLLQLPSAAMFSVADLESEGWEERTRITECLLTLKRYHDSEQHMSATPLTTRPFKSPGTDTTSRFSPLQLGTSANTPKHAATPDFDLVTQQYIGGSSNNPLKKVAVAGKDATAGVTRLMQQCTSMLRERMWSDGGKHTPVRGALTNGDMGSTMEAMGPVLESVLGSLTQVRHCL